MVTMYGSVLPEQLGARLLAGPGFPEKDLVLTVDMDYASCSLARRYISGS